MNGSKNGSSAKLVVSSAIIKEGKVSLPLNVSPPSIPIAELTTNFAEEPQKQRSGLVIDTLLALQAP